MSANPSQSRITLHELTDNLQGESDGSQTLDTMTDDREARNDFWSVEGNHIYRRHVEPRVKLHVPKDEKILIPLRCIDGVRTTHTTLDVLQEGRMDDHWNIDANGHLSDSWTCFTQVATLYFRFPIADGTAKLFGRDDGVRKLTLTRDQLARREDLRGDLQGNSEKSQPIDETR